MSASERTAVTAADGAQGIVGVPYVGDPAEVGRGSFGTVYRAWDHQADRPVAVKLLSLGGDDRALKAFDRERQALARLSTHPNVITLHRTGVTVDGVPYLVMEFAPGGSLADRVADRGPLAWLEAIGWLAPVCEAVAHAHAEGIQHCDIKPHNILISAHDSPLLSDFGISRLAAGTETVTNVKLSLAYASPEQVDGHTPGDASDVYSIGATLHALLTGRAPFIDEDGAGFLHTAKRILEEEPPPLPPDVPADIADAIGAALAKDPADRPTAAELGRALRRSARIPARAPLSAPPSATTHEDRRFKRAALVALAVLAVAGVAVGAWLAAGGGDSDETGQLASDAVEAVGDASTPGTNSDTSGDDTESESETDTGGAQTTAQSSEQSSEQQAQATSLPEAVPAELPAIPTTVPAVADRDDDSVPDEEDNCPELANQGQVDTDADGRGDVCDRSPRGMVAVAATAQVNSVTIVNDGINDGDPDMFGDLKLNDTTFDLPLIPDRSAVRPGNWLTDQVPLETSRPLLQVRVWIRDEAMCFLCKDILVDLTPDPASERLHLIVDTNTGQVELADEAWNRLEPVGTLAGPDDGDLSATLTFQGDDENLHIATIEMALTLARQPAP